MPLKLKPAHRQELAAALAAATARGEAIAEVDVSALNRVSEHHPSDQTVTVEAGLTLGALQELLARHGQWLPVDPAHATRLTLRELIDANLSGPRRCGHGTIRDHVLGLTVALADGTLARSGGRVVKNVAGYDLAKLFIGAGGSLGVVTEVTFKLKPLPQAEEFLAAPGATLEAAAQLLEAVAGSALTPVVLDLHRLDPATPGVTVVAGFAGAREDVAWETARARALGFTAVGDLGHEPAFWSAPGAAHRLSVLPALVAPALRPLGAATFVARAGNGVIYHRGPAAAPAPPAPGPLAVMRRLKAAFDPAGIFPNPLPPPAPGAPPV